MGQVNQQLVENVTGAFEMITQELSKPQEDVVGISVCGATKGAITNVMKLYLEGKGVDVSQAKIIDDLIKMCKAQDKKFQSFDFSSLHCRCEPSNDHSLSYCMGEDKIDSCYKLLIELKNYVFQDLKIEGN